MVDFDSTTTPNTLYIATDNRVFVSDDEENIWKDFSDGLPERPHCKDLRFVVDKNGSMLLYLGTYGWSLWRANLAAVGGDDGVGRGGGGSGPVFGGTEAQGSDGSSGSIKVGPNGVTQTATGANGESVSRSVSR